MPATLSSTTLMRLTSEASLTLFHCAPQMHVRCDPAASLALSGAPYAGLNFMCFEGAPANHRALEAYVIYCDACAVPFTAMVGPDIAEELAPYCEQVGLKRAEPFQLMVRAAAGVAPIDVAGVTVRRVEDEATMRASAEALSEAFEMPSESIYGATPFEATTQPNLEVFVAERGGQVVSSVTCTLHGSVAGIWAMGTRPDEQGKGAGKALLTSAMHALSTRGVENFFLLATTKGAALYLGQGFERIGDADVWVMGDGPQY